MMQKHFWSGLMHMWETQLFGRSLELLYWPTEYLRSSLVAIVLFLLTDDYKSSWQKRTQHHTYES